MNELEERTETTAPQGTGGTARTQLLCEFLNEQWKDELGMKATINTAHPNAEMDAYRMHELNMLRYEQIFKVVCQADKYKRALEFIQAWGMWSTDDRTPKEWPRINGKPMTAAEIVNDALRA